MLLDQKKKYKYSYIGASRFKNECLFYRSGRGVKSTNIYTIWVASRNQYYWKVILNSISIFLIIKVY